MSDDDHLPRGPLGRLDEPTPVELEAQSLLSAVGGWRSDEPVLDMIGREIGSVLEQAGELRELQRDLDRDLLRSECRVRTDLLLRTPLYGLADHAPQRATLKNRLEQLGRERRSISLDLHGRRRALTDRLALLLERHRQVRGEVVGG